MKRTFKTVIAVLLAIVCMFSVAACNSDDSTADLIVGAVMVGDETEGYTEAHMNGIQDAVKALAAEGKKVEIIYKKKIEENATCATACSELISSGAKLIVTNSYGHQFQIGDVVKENSGVTFVSMTGDMAKKSGYANWKNAFTNVYESRYVSGVVAGLKLKSLVDAKTISKEATATAYNGDNIKIGYVGAFPYAEVVSGYTAFYLGLKSVVPNIEMSVKYTNSWFNFDDEKQTAAALISEGCVIIGQHADSEGAPTACEEAFNKGTVVYSIGYNVDMLKAAPNAALTSSANHWAVYYTYLFKAMINGETVATDWSKGYSEEAVGITTLGKSCAEGTQAKVDETIAKIKAGTLKIFDCSKFTIDDGAAVTTTIDQADMAIWNAATKTNDPCKTEYIETAGEVKYFSESTVISAPAFAFRIDGITEVIPKS